MSSTCYIGQDLGHSVAPLLGSFAVESLGYGAMFYIYAGILLVGGGLIYYLKDKYDQKKYGISL